jgi:hypothetical protein
VKGNNWLLFIALCSCLVCPIINENDQISHQIYLFFIPVPSFCTWHLDLQEIYAGLTWKVIVKCGIVLCSNVIDVAALDSHNLEQHEYLDRVKHYTQKLQSMSRWTPPRRPPCLLVDIPAPEKLLAAEPLTQQDLNLVS